jgi:uncharacterized damage-inducible protein DinB
MYLIQDAETKLIKLAEAIPADKYSWRPGKDVRSVSEVFLHVAGGNFRIPQFVGVAPPADFNPQGFDKSITDKAKVVDTLKQSFVHAKQALTKLTDADLEKQADFFGRKATYRMVMFFLAAHQHEHLGQSIAYARVIGVTPPWTEEQQHQKAQQPKPKT